MLECLYHNALVMHNFFNPLDIFLAHQVFPPLPEHISRIEVAEGRRALRS